MQLIPKQQAPKIVLPWQNILFYVSLAIFALALGIYFLLFYLESRNADTLQNLQGQISRLGAKEEKAMEKEIFARQKEIRDFAVIFREQQKSSGFFGFLEEISHPRVWFSQLELDSQAGRAVISGQTDGFQVLGQQLSIFQNNERITETNLSDLAMNKEGGVDFVFQLSLDKKIFQQEP